MRGLGGRPEDRHHQVVLPGEAGGDVRGGGQGAGVRAPVGSAFPSRAYLRIMGTGNRETPEAGPAGMSLSLKYGTGERQVAAGPDSGGSW